MSFCDACLLEMLLLMWLGKMDPSAQPSPRKFSLELILIEQESEQKWTKSNSKWNLGFIQYVRYMYKYVYVMYLYVQYR